MTRRVLLFGDSHVHAIQAALKARGPRPGALRFDARRLLKPKTSTEATQPPPKAGARDMHFQDHVIGNAVELLQERSAPLPLAELEHIALTRTHNARMSTLRAIARQGTAAALDSLMALYPKLPDASSRDSLLNSLQTLATQLGLRVDVDGEQLTVSSI